VNADRPEASPRAAPPSPVAPPPAPGRTERSLLRRIVTRERLVRLGVAVGGTVAAFVVVVLLGVWGVYDLAYARSILPSLLRGFYLTVGLIALVIPTGFVIGFFVGWGRTSRSRIVRTLAAAYVDFFRSLPPLALIAFAFILGLLVFRQTIADFYLVQKLALGMGVLALALHTGAYQAEIIRAGIQSVPTAQTEAADAIGMTRGSSMVRIVLPQAFRVSLPALGNEFSSVIKDSSLLSVIGLLELSGIGLVQVYSGLLIWVYAPLVVWLEIAVLYFVATTLATTVVRAVEEAFRVPGLETARA